jgi:transglutaminase-like putative cysteine protease
VRSWRVRLPLYAAGLATGGAFGVLFTGEALPYMIWASLVAMLVGSAGAYRFVLLFPATALYTLLAVYGAPPLSFGGWRDLLEGTGYDVWEAAGIMYANPVPYDAHPGLLVVLIPVVMIVVAFATSATLYEESPVVSVSVLGLTIGVLSTVSFEAGVGPFFFLFLPAAVALLLLTASESPVPASVVAGAVVVGFVLLLPALPGAREVIRPGLVDWTSIGTGGTSRLAVEADVGDYLTAGRDAELLRIRSPEPLLWRGGTLDYFDGARWSSTVEPGEDYGEEISEGVPTRNVVQAVEVLNAETDLLFGGYRMTSVSLTGARERSDASWSSPLPLQQGSDYRVLSEIPQPTEAQLEASGDAYPAEVREKFLQLPEGRPEILGETAREIERDYNPATPYAAARAVERYLIYDGGFTYNLDVDYSRADRAIEEFLGDGREGFCTQFATSMALILREQGIPSRVVYGAVTGEQVEPNEYVVTGNNMHTWVEAYFPGVGWYPFDPTPGFDVPSAMEVNAPRPALPAAADGITPENRALGGDQPAENAPDPDQSPAARNANGATETPAWAWALFAIPMILLVAAVPLLKRALAARGRPEDLYRDLLGRLRDALPPGKAALADSTALTPTEKLVLLSGAAGVEEGPPRELAHAYSESLYAAQGPDERPARHGAARAYRRALYAYRKLPRWRRSLAAVNPSSLLLRARRWIAGRGARFGKRLRGRFRKRS